MPPPADHPNLLLFDGICHLCNGTVQWVLQHDPAGRISFCPIQSETGRQLYRQHGLDPEQPGTMLLITDRGVHARSDAALEIARLIGRPWSLLRAFRLIPKRLRDGAYGLIAANRYRWFGRHDQCMLPRPEWRQRFLD